MNKQFTRFASHVSEMSADEIKNNLFKKEDSMTSLELALLCAKNHTTYIKRLGYAMSVSFDKTFVVSSGYFDDHADEMFPIDDIKFYADTIEDAKIVALEICKSNDTTINKLKELIDIEDIL